MQIQKILLIIFLLLCIGNDALLQAQTYRHRIIPNNPDNQIPKIHLQLDSGELINVNSYGNNGKVTIFKFWTGRATDCRQDLEKTAELVNSWKGQLDIEIVAVNLDPDSYNKELRDLYFQYKDWEFVNLVDTGDLLLSNMSRRANVIPYTIVTDHRGRIVGEYGGTSETNRTVLEKAIKDARSKLPVVTFEELRRRREKWETEYYGETTKSTVTADTSTEPIPSLKTSPNNSSAAKILKLNTANTNKVVPSAAPKPKVAIEAEPLPEIMPELPVANPKVAIEAEPLPEIMPELPVANETVDPAPLPKSLAEVELSYKNDKTPKLLGKRKVKRGKKMFVDSNVVGIHVWDVEDEDGDIISLYFNGKWILKEYRLTNQEKRLKVKLEEGADNQLIVYAHNEGSKPPNTAAMIIFTRSGRKNVSLNSDMKNCDTIKFQFLDEGE